MKRRVFFTGLMGLISGVLLNAQVTIVSMIEPGEGALLELKEHTPQGNNSTATKGLLFPRVALTSYDNLFPMFQGVLGTDYVKDGKYYPKADEDATHIGLVVYNTNVTTFTEGLHFWDGTGWLLLSGTTPISPQIDDLVCGSVTMTNNSLKNGEFFETVMKITYLNGNGGTYSGTQPEAFGTSGFNIERLGGTLAIGQGEVSYRISGYVTTNNPTIIVSHAIVFLGKTYCSDITVGQEVAIKNLQFMRKTVALDSAAMIVNSETRFGNLVFRLRHAGKYGAHTAVVRPEIKTVAGLNTRMVYWFRKAGTGGAFYALFGQIPMVSDTWYLIGSRGKTDSDSNDPDPSNVNSASTTYSGGANSIISATNRNMAEVIILLQNNNLREMYHVTYNAHGEIAASDGVPAVAGSVTIFVEKWD